MSRWRQSSSGSSISLKIARWSTKRVTVVITIKCFKKIFSHKIITYNLNFSFQLGFSVADFTSVARMNLAGIALRANTIMIITLIIVMTVVMFITAIMIMISKYGCKYESLLLLITAFCVCACFSSCVFMCLYIWMRRRIIDGQNIQKSSKRWRGIIEKVRA